MNENTTQPAIEFINVTKTYASTVAVENVSLQVAEGDFCVLVGSSGCGKSTTLKMVNLLVEPTAGEIRFKGKSVQSFEPEQLRRQIGYVIQSIGLFPHWTVADNIGVVPRLVKWAPKRIRERTVELLQMLHLEPKEFLTKYPDELSGGQAQRVGVARALAANPDVMLMDEPFGALDPITRESLQDEMARLHKQLGKTVLFVTHDIDEAFRLASKIAVMHEGRILQFDTPENIRKQPANPFVRDFIGI